MAYDIQRIQHLSRLGASPFLMALSLYLDIYNLFLYVLRFMLAILALKIIATVFALGAGGVGASSSRRSCSGR